MTAETWRELRELRMMLMLEIAPEVIVQAHRTATVAEEWIRADHPANLERLSYQDRVLIGLTLKMVATFEALADDARARRGEAMHHLKPLCEAFIYLYESAASEERAKLVLAHALEQRLRYWHNNPGSMAPDVMADVRAERAALSLGLRRLPSNVTQVKQVAGRHPNLLGWYNQVYGLACEPAHISDIDDFFPDEDGRLPHSGTPYASDRAYDALVNALRIMFALGRFWNDGNRIGLAIDQADLELRFENALKRTTAEEKP